LRVWRPGMIAARAVAGDTARAHAELAARPPDHFAALARDRVWLPALRLRAEGCAQLRHPAAAGALLLEPPPAAPGGALDPVPSAPPSPSSPAAPARESEPPVGEPPASLRLVVRAGLGLGRELIVEDAPGGSRRW